MTEPTRERACDPWWRQRKRGRTRDTKWYVAALPEVTQRREDELVTADWSDSEAAEVH